MPDRGLSQVLQRKIVESEDFTVDLCFPPLLVPTPDTCGIPLGNDSCRKLGISAADAQLAETSFNIRLHF